MNIDLERIRAYFKDDRFATENGVVIDSVTEDSVVCSMELEDRHRNSVGRAHGGAIFTLADLAFAAHCNMAMVCGEDVNVTVAQSNSITYLKSTNGKRLIARSACLSRGKTVSVYRICIEDDLGVPIAEMLSSAITLARR